MIYVKWTAEDENFLKSNMHLSNTELADALGRSQASVENKIRNMGLARTFREHEIETLKELWGNKRIVLVNAIPRFTWKQICKKAYNLGLPPLVVERDSTNLYSIVAAMGESCGVAQKWIAAGLPVTVDKVKGVSRSSYMVDVEKFWKFAMKHPEVVDLTRLESDAVFDVLGPSPYGFREVRSEAKPHKRLKVYPTVPIKKRVEIAEVYFASDMPVERIALRYGIAVEAVQRIATEFKKPGQERKRLNMMTEAFLSELDRLHNQEGKSKSECARILGCGASSVARAIKQIGEFRYAG